MRKHRARNLEIPGLVLRTIPDDDGKSFKRFTHDIPKTPRSPAFDLVGIGMRETGIGLRRDFDPYRRGYRFRNRHVRRIGGVAGGARRSRYRADHADRTCRTDAPDVARLGI